VQTGEIVVASLKEIGLNLDIQNYFETKTPR
jgi:hypothetical protein